MSYEKKKRVTIPGLVFLMFLFIGILIGIMPLTGTTAYGEISAVTGVRVTKNKTYNTVSWKKNSLATGYKVYRREGSGSYKLVKTTTAGSFNDKKVKKGKKYSYKIQVYYKNYTYNTSKKKYTSKTITGKYSKTVSVKR